MIDLGDTPVTLDVEDPVERVLTAVAVERRKRRAVAAVWDDRFDFPVAVLLDLLDELEASETPPGRAPSHDPPEPFEGASGPEGAPQGSSQQHV